LSCAGAPKPSRFRRVGVHRSDGCRQTCHLPWPRRPRGTSHERDRFQDPCSNPPSNRERHGPGHDCVGGRQALASAHGTG